MVGAYPPLHAHVCLFSSVPYMINDPLLILDERGILMSPAHWRMGGTAVVVGNLCESGVAEAQSWCLRCNDYFCPRELGTVEAQSVLV